MLKFLPKWAKYEYYFYQILTPASEISTMPLNGHNMSGLDIEEKHHNYVFAVEKLSP